jgi:hypothetical protein
MTEHSIDPAIAEAVQAISNRFGVLGLEEMIEAARVELERAREALALLDIDRGVEDDARGRDDQG